MSNKEVIVAKNFRRYGVVYTIRDADISPYGLVTSNDLWPYIWCHCGVRVFHLSLVQTASSVTTTDFRPISVSSRCLAAMCDTIIVRIVFACRKTTRHARSGHAPPASRYAWPNAHARARATSCRDLEQRQRLSGESSVATPITATPDRSDVHATRGKLIGRARVQTLMCTFTIL